MEAALQVAETGHLVFSTLHTNSAAQTVDRVIDAFPENKQSQVRTQLATTLVAVVSQRLLPVTGGGRRVAAEIMVVTPAIRNAIREGKVYQVDNMIQTGGEMGMMTMEKSLVALVREGLISTEVAQTYANRPEDLLSLLGKNA
jgi:twitching motility protein PilT